MQPTVFSHVTNDMTIAREEIFGPVLVMIGYEDDDDAVRIANDTVVRAVRLHLRERRSGPGDGPSHPHGQRPPQRRRPDLNAPFGGYKQSGNGREWGELGIEEFLETKAILGYSA